MFEASRPFAFFDYFRVPYQIRESRAAGDADSVPTKVNRLHAAGGPGSKRSLFWLDSGQSEQWPAGGFLLGQYAIDDCTFFGHVALNTAVPALLPQLGSDWQPAEPIRNGHQEATAAIWRDSAGNVFLPFDPGEIMHNFWSEQYRNVGRSGLSVFGHAAALRCYYLIRPMLPRPVQLRLRRAFTQVQARATFPGWPFEDSLHSLYSRLFDVITEVAGCPVPYIGPWPDGRSWALVLTHDVETDVGYRGMDLLRAPEREHGFGSSWNFVGERYVVDDDTVRALQADGCEVGVHGLRHDGRDLGSARLMEQRLPAMRAYAERWGAVGFRSPATQRDWDLMPRLGFTYDSSYSDTDPYEPQPGGCCTYLPYFNRKMTELPITLPQDHTLFTILQHPDADLWIRKAQHIRERNGMVLILTHPDYADDPRLVTGYRSLLDTFQGDASAWQALPREVAEWWNDRAASTIRENAGGWEVTGPASGRGRVHLTTAGGRAQHATAPGAP